METINLRQTLDIPAGAGQHSRRAWAATLPGGRPIALLEGARVWIPDRATLKLVRQLDLLGDGNCLAFTSDSQELLTLDGCPSRARSEARSHECERCTHECMRHEKLCLPMRE
jgi:hypothetical protein